MELKIAVGETTPHGFLWVKHTLESFSLTAYTQNLKITQIHSLVMKLMNP